MNTDRPTLTPDGVAYARFILEATPWGGVAASNAIMLHAQAIACDLDQWDRSCQTCDGCAEYTEAERAEDARKLKHLFPFVQCLDPVMASDMALLFPFLWEGRDGEE
jgi:hypothetical protein